MSAAITVEQINKFVRAWYLALDQHAEAEECINLVAEDVEMIFPEKTLHGVSDFKAWYAGGVYSDGEKAPGVINIFFDENHNVVSVEPTTSLNPSPSQGQVKLQVVVAWQASWFVPPAAKSKRVSLDAIQEWIVRRSDRNRYGLEISSYNAMAEPFVYAPGFARL